MKIFKREVRLLYHSIRDLLVAYLPDFSDKKKYKYAFLVHPRNISDVYRKYPLFRIFPPRVLEFLLRGYWPVILSHVTGLKSQKTGNEIEGFVMTISLTARQMIENRDLSLKKIIRALKLAKKNGAQIIGLGGLTSSLTKGGIDLINKVKGISITTGHAYTAFNVTENLFELVRILDVEKKNVIVAIVGAAGSVGSTSAKIIARANFQNLLLIDIERKKNQFPGLLEEIKSLSPNATVSFSHQIKDIKNADFIITATNAPEALIRSEDLKVGAVIIDDAQPSDVSADVFKREDVLVVEAGVVHTPNILSHFNFNLKNRQDNFCCMAEVLILASLEHTDHYVINRATLEKVDEISYFGKNLGFNIGEFQNFNESISHDKIMKIKEIIHSSAQF